MKVKLALFSTLVFSALSLPNPGFTQSFPTCLSSGSDSDGDGYGWENNGTCLVDANTGTNMTGQCEDRGGFPWGWNPVTLTSCRLDEQQQQQIEPETFDTVISTLINQRNNYWRCRTTPLESPQSNVLDIVFQEDGVSSVIFLGIENQGSPLPSAVDAHPGGWSRGYPIENRELHINGTFTIRPIFGNSGFIDHIGLDLLDKQYLNSWQIILQDIDLLDEPVTYPLSFTDTSVELESFEATMHFIDSITDLSFPVTCTTAFPQLFDYVPYER